MSKYINNKIKKKLFFTLDWRYPYIAIPNGKIKFIVISLLKDKKPIEPMSEKFTWPSILSSGINNLGFKIHLMISKFKTKKDAVTRKKGAINFL